MNPSMRIARSITLAVLIAAPTGCGGDGATSADQSPSVTIQQVALEGAASNVLEVSGSFSDDHGVDSVVFHINGVRLQKLPVQGRTGSFDFTSPEQQPGSGTARVTAFDDAGNSASDSRGYDVVLPKPIVDAEVLVLRQGEIVPAASTQFCIETVCGTTDAQGKVRLEGLPWKASYAIHFIAGANTNFLVVPNRSRLEPNWVNYTNADHAAGREPTHTDLRDGVNERRYLFFEDGPGTMNLQAIIDNHTGRTTDYAQIFRSEDGDGLVEPSNGKPGSKFKFVYHGIGSNDTVTVAVYTEWYQRPETADSVSKWVLESFTFGQRGFEKIWKEPHKHPFKKVFTAGAGFISYNEPGVILVMPVDGRNFGTYLVRALGEDERVAIDRIAWLQVNVDGPGGAPYARTFVQSVGPAFLAGSPRLANRVFDTYMSEVGTSYNRTWGPADEHAYLFLLAFDHETTFLLSESYR